MNGPRHRQIVIRDAVEQDMAACRDLYNALIGTTSFAWTEEHQTLRQRRSWFARQQRGGFPVLVAEHHQGVVGFAAYGRFRGSGRRSGYRRTVEHTIHIDEDHWGRGLGRLLMNELLARARHEGVHVMVGAIDSGNLGSIEFHQKLGFTEVARMPEVGRKFDRWLDLVLMQRIVDGT